MKAMIPYGRQDFLEASIQTVVYDLRAVFLANGPLDSVHEEGVASI
jgi:hypothetical protein